MQEPQTEQDVEIEPAPEPPRSRSSLWIAAAFFLLGALVGVVGLAASTALTAKKPPVDSVAMREAAREGMLDAVATLNASQGQVPERGTPAPVKTSFNLRDTNRKGNKAAKVTIVEFSDFQ